MSTSGKPQDNEGEQSFVVIPVSILQCKKLTTAEQFVMGLIIQPHDDDDGRYYETVKMTATRLGLNESTVRRVRAKFAKLGFIEKIGFIANRTVYRVNISAIKEALHV